MFIDAAGPRYTGTPEPDPDEERRRRWEPISNRILLPVVGSVFCVIFAGAAGALVSYALDLTAVALCFSAARAAWPQRDGRAGRQARPDAPPRGRDGPG